MQGGGVAAHIDAVHLINTLPGMASDQPVPGCHEPVTGKISPFPPTNTTLATTKNYDFESSLMV